MSDLLETALIDLRHAGMAAYWEDGDVAVMGRGGRAALVIGKPRGGAMLLLTQFGEALSDINVTEWTPRHTSAVQAWIEEAVMTEGLE